MKLEMKKQYIILLCAILCGAMLTGCSNISKELQGQIGRVVNKVEKEIGGLTNGEQSQSAQNQAAVEKTVTLGECVPLEDLLALNHRDGGNKFRYLDPIPEEYWNIADKNGTKGIAVQYDGKMYKLYRNGKVIDEAGNVKHNTPDNSTNDVDVFTAWILSLREDDMLGRDVVYQYMTYDVEKVITYDELKNMLHVVYITTENFHDYFTFIDVEEEEEITHSSFVDEHLYMPNITRRYAYKGPGYLMNSGSFEWQIDIIINYDEKYKRVETDADGNVTYEYECEYHNETAEKNIRCYEFKYAEEGEYRSVGYNSMFSSDLLVYYTDIEKSYLSKTENFYDNMNVLKAQGFFIYCDDIPEERWNITEKGNRYVCVQRQDGSAWRFCEYGRIGSNVTDVDAFLEKDITATMDGTPKQLRKDILCLNGNDLNNFIGIDLDTVLGE